jgi:2-keto-4-pentenoate hydratase
MDNFDARQALETFLRNRQAGTFFPKEWEGSLLLEEAYAVQLALVQHHKTEGRRQIGWKVGLTATPIQDQFSVHEPGFGFLLEDGLHSSGDSIPHGTLIGPGFENELCVTMATDLAGPGATRAQAEAAISTVAPAFELVETRGDFTGHLEMVVPDNLQQKGVILGTPIRMADAPDLDGVKLTVFINGVIVDIATGDAVLGHPVNSVTWLANRLAEHGKSLAAGDLVMTGSFTRQYAIGPGDTIRSEFEGVGAVEANFP